MCEWSCCWRAPMPLPFCKPVLQTATGSEEETRGDLPGTHLVQNGEKIYTRLAESFSVKQVIAPCLLSCHSCLLLDAHNKSTVVWTAALCWNLTIPHSSNSAAFQYFPSWKLQVYLGSFQYTRSDSNSYTYCIYNLFHFPSPVLGSTEPGKNMTFLKTSLFHALSGDYPVSHKIQAKNSRAKPPRDLH